MLDAIRCFSVVGTDVESIIILDPTLVGVQESTISRSKFFRVVYWGRTII